MMGQSAMQQAARLRTLSGLNTERIAGVLGVSRQTYHKWLTCHTLLEAHRDRLFEVLALVEEAHERHGAETSNWLLTPVSPGGKKPVDYLTEREYIAFRGFLLRARNHQEFFGVARYTEHPPEEVEARLQHLRDREVTY
jgi:transcriptional regulator with XRE-family HTH domain